MARLNDVIRIEVDPNFFVPPGVIGISQAESSGSQSTYGQDIIDVEDDGYFEEVDTLGPITDAGDGGNEILGVPSNFSVFSQTVKILPDGTAMVDVILDIPDVPGANNYEVRITK